MSKLIAIWGSSESGKTVMTVKLAQLLAKKKQKVIVLFVDMTTPEIPYIFPKRKNSESDSLFSVGEVLSKTDITEQDILKNIIISKDSSNIGYLGYTYGNNIYSYAYPDTNKAHNLMKILCGMADYVIVDCEGSAENVLARAAIENSDNLIKMYSPNYKSWLFFGSQEPIILDAIKNKDKKQIISVVNIVSKDIYMPIEEMKSTVKADFVLPYSFSLKRQSFDGTVTQKPAEKKLEKVLSKIAELIISTVVK